MYVPGEYSFNKINHRVNNFGFIGEEVSINNKTGCRIVALGGSTTAGTETENPYPNILENAYIDWPNENHVKLVCQIVTKLQLRI